MLALGRKAAKADEPVLRAENSIDGLQGGLKDEAGSTASDASR